MTWGWGEGGQRDCCSPRQTFQQLSKILQFGDWEKNKRNALPALTRSEVVILRDKFK